MTFAEIARGIGKSTTAAYNIYTAALKKLRNALGFDDDLDSPIR